MIYSSNHLEYLCRKLSGKLRQQGEDIFGREIIVTQTVGMTSWLKTSLAQMNGVIANMSFMNQDALTGEIYRLITGEKLRNNRDLLRFRVYDLLGDQEFKNTFTDVSGYYDGNDLKRIQLSDKIADIFDQYQLYRPEMIEAWEAGSFIFEQSEVEKWQQWLWKKAGVESRKTAIRKITETLNENKGLVKKHFPRISLFGISVFTKFHLEFFRKLSEITELDIYLCLPNGKNKYENNLLASLGSKAAELQEMVRATIGDFDFASMENIGYSSLNKLQNQILNNVNEPDFADYDTIQINSCYTPVREAECLYNYLLDLFERDRNRQEKMKADDSGESEELKPGDILVMTTDINKYAPFIKAVFRNAPVKIPFLVSGAAGNSEDSIVSAIEQILNFTEQDLTSEKVVSLLEHKRIRKRFSVSDSDYVRSVVRKAGIRFGRENRTEDDTVYVSWKYGLEKILLGYTMLTEEPFTSEVGPVLFPYRDTEAAVSHDLLRLIKFVEMLESVLDREAEEQTMSEWKGWLFEEIIEKMIYHDDFTREDRDEMNSVWKALAYIDSLDSEKKVPFCVFLSELGSKLFTEPAEIKLNTGNVTVSSCLPVRGIPFKVICFLGLDNEVFPRKDQFLGFDLLGEKYEAGDRSKKENDKYIFLDTILSARGKLYLSYLGQNVKDNTDIPPSIVIDTLTDYLGENIKINKHPLHGFSSRYNRDSANKMFTYLYRIQAEDFMPNENDEKKISELSVSSFVSFFENPIDWYFENILGIKYKETDDTVPETELFGLDHLQEWIVKQQILKHGADDIVIFLERGIKEGQLPLKNLGRITVERLDHKISELKARYLEQAANRQESCEVIDLVLDGIRINGTIDGVYGREYIAYAFSDRKKYRARAYLNALLLYSLSKIDIVHFLYLVKNNDKNKPDSLQEVTINMIDPENAKDRLSELIQYFIKGTSAPLKFTPAAAGKIIDNKAVENIFLEEAEGNRHTSLPQNLCINHLYNENYFEEFDIEDFVKQDFNPELYGEPRFDEIRKIADLLNLSPQNNE